MSTTGKPLNRAVAAFNSLLAQASAIHLTEIGVGWPVAAGEAAWREIDILAQVEVFGRSHTLACQVSSDSDAQHVRTALEQLRNQIAFLPGKVTPVLILPVLSPEVQALCEGSNAACLDLHGNGRLAVDEIFISIRSLPRRVLHHADSGKAVSPRRSIGDQMTAQITDADAGQSVLRGFPPAHAALQRPALSSRQSRKQ
jgi:hypothetical protein